MIKWKSILKLPKILTPVDVFKFFPKLNVITNCLKETFCCYIYETFTKNED